MLNKQLESILTELKTASLSINAGKDSMDVMHEYNIMFLGEKNNLIYSHELLSLLSNRFDLKTDIDSINSAIPSVCSALGMKFEPKYPLNDPTAQKPNTYTVSLW